MSDSRDFDPRFDPAFQRGYVDDGGRAPRQYLGIEALGLTSGPIGLPPEGVEPSEPRALPHPEPAAVSLEGNPWVKVLWVIVPVLIIGGLVGQIWAQSLNFGAPATPDAFTNYIIPAIAYSVCPGMVQVGFAALAGVVFLYAVRWRRVE